MAQADSTCNTISFNITKLSVQVRRNETGMKNRIVATISYNCKTVLDQKKNENKNIQVQDVVQLPKRWLTANSLVLYVKAALALC